MMASQGPGKPPKPGTSGVRNPKRLKKDDEEEEDLEQLMEQDPQDKPKWKTVTIYSKLSTGEFIMKGTDQKA